MRRSRNQQTYPIGTNLMIALAFFFCTGVHLLSPSVLSAFVDSADTSSQHHSSLCNPSSCGDELSNSSGTIHLLDLFVLASTVESVFTQLGSSATIPYSFSDTPHSIGGAPLFLRLSTLRN
jgi:hypothetical protein